MDFLAKGPFHYEQMHFKVFLIVFIFNSFQAILGQKKEDFKVVTVAFYNLENLFDTLNDPITFDDDRTPDGKDHWTEEIYQEKLKNMAFVINKIGAEVAQTSPAILGVAEIENRKVLEDLVNQPLLKEKNYGIVHYDSPDRRGIDVALLYQKDLFKVIKSTAYELSLYDTEEPDKRVYTRDQLLVSGILDTDNIFFIVNHWPSRRGGEARSSYKREAAAALNKRIIDSLQASAPNVKIVTMGDFNDDPINKSIKKVLGAKDKKRQVKSLGLFNPMGSIFKTGTGTLAYRDRWNLFDQIILSEPFLKKDFNSYRFYKAGIFNEAFLSNPDGRYKGYPYRSFANGSYTGGYSDHFPVYVYLIKRVE
ncbi:endonuclease/exonuclease/phosphatase family protein [Flavimarina sp. Hel_I_48]|uniref:endonuclease/exonuclease/phosphatase family protein n=1 Tax=Flavimarina sp. Hel_I_48 TaxID=1392488 RepID=UPI001F14486E|nr:endonuclease/exonuclease/phosphatase family protein [Flavimarina sp. Hel_I_48]